MLLVFNGIFKLKGGIIKNTFCIYFIVIMCYTILGGGNMKDIYLTNYAVKGIKTLDELVSLSFYRKTITRDMDTQEYNVKGIYGMNGSGKSGIVTSVDILKNLLMNPGYLNNPIVQKNLDAIINKKISQLFMEVDFVAKTAGPLMHFKYNVTLSKDSIGKYVISNEKLAVKRATFPNESLMLLFEVVNGEIIYIDEEENDGFVQILLKKTMNLLATNSMCALFLERIIAPGENNHMEENSNLFSSICILLFFASKLYVCMEQSDDHRNHIMNKVFNGLEISELEFDNLIKSFVYSEMIDFDVITGVQDIVLKEKYDNFESTIEKLCEFIRIFKSDLLQIEIDKKIDRDTYVCDLIMVYDGYKIHAEFESTGIKKLIRLYAYLQKMAEGEIVFIDEFDSNLHDVYLCALLEYLMEYGKGQLCFTTHNVGPMDILKQHKKSIDFLSIDHKIYSWKTNGNYSPSKLYKNGMIEGSPFNVDSIDFIGVFSTNEGGE